MLAGCTSSSHYDYTHLPSGYNWRAVYDRHTKVIVFYGQEPLSRETVYVGPDSQFYIFDHKGRIQDRDLRRHWTPHDAL
jgi:hypothetical protein